ncbi:MAG TPA: DUF3540 domain-containing protein [Sandaracinaceae bacterium LLY-WYZ-13_1]|nr:DUF3540 domain-containing protein [Sandaracinaceae bacterium LLY-WYZ-13_1]
MGHPAETIRRNGTAPLRRYGQQSALVEAVDGDAVAVRAASGRRAARRAASCLVAPAAGDEVLLAVSEDGEVAFVLAVLVRSEGGPTRVDLEGSLSITAREVEVRGREAVRFHSPEGIVEAVGRRLRLKAEERMVLFETLSYLGRQVAGNVRVTKLAGALLDQAYETVTQRAQRVYRTVTEAENVEAKTMTVRCEDALAVHGEHTVMTATKIVKIDGAQVLMG